MDNTAPLNSFQRGAIRRLAACDVRATPLGNWLSIHGWAVMTEARVDEIIADVKRTAKRGALL